jgi:hypothetical protein
LTAARSQDVAGVIADNDAVLVDGRTFTIISGKIKGDASIQIKTSGAQELGPGAIVFRVDRKFYVVDAPLHLGANAADRQTAGVRVDEAQVNRIRVEYEPPKNPKHQAVYERIRGRRVLETLQQMLGPFQLPVELTIKTMGCDGMINSWFSYDNSVPYGLFAGSATAKCIATARKLLDMPVCITRPTPLQRWPMTSSIRLALAAEVACASSSCSSVARRPNTHHHHARSRSGSIRHDDA